MFALTRKADYALVALAELARHAPEIMSARRLAELTSVPLPVLSAVLNQLLRRSLVVSVRGVQGGYRLAKSPEAIRLVDVVEAIDGPARLTQCCSTPEDHDHASDACNLESRCRIMGPMQRVHHTLREFMSRIVLSHIAFDVVPMRVEARERALSAN